MTTQLSNQDKMHLMIGAIVCDRVAGGEADRLDTIFSREFIIEVLKKGKSAEGYSDQDIADIYNYCV